MHYLHNKTFKFVAYLSNYTDRDEVNLIPILNNT